MNNRYQIIIALLGDSKNAIPFYEKLESDNLIELLAKLPLSIATMIIKEEEHKKLIEKIGEANDDIPF